MWSTQTIWFDTTIVFAIFAVGNIVFGHFEEHRPKWRRVLKVFVVTAIAAVLTVTVGRVWTYSFIGAMLLGAAYVHAIWLPRRGVNGLTGEPRARYYEVIGHTPRPNRDD